MHVKKYDEYNDGKLWQCCHRRNTVITKSIYKYMQVHTNRINSLFLLFSLPNSLWELLSQPDSVAVQLHSACMHAHDISTASKTPWVLTVLATHGIPPSSSGVSPPQSLQRGKNKEQTVSYALCVLAEWRPFVVMAEVWGDRALESSRGRERESKQVVVGAADCWPPPVFRLANLQQDPRRTNRLKVSPQPLVSQKTLSCHYNTH